MSEIDPVILVHGGAAIIAPDRVFGKMTGVKNAVREAYRVLINQGNALDAVETAVRLMENDSYFNAGYGSVLNIDGEVEMDASIMDGSDLSCGAVAMVRDVSNPITLARLVKEKTPHVLLAGIGTSQFARQQNIPIVSTSTLVSEYSWEVLQNYKKNGSRPEDREIGGTVGAVAVDKNGRVAAATSTGGTTGKMMGRIGDTPQIGSGTYADNYTGAISCTGNGESILKINLAYAIHKDLEIGKTASDATKDCVNRMTERLQGTGGAITVSKSGDIGIHFTTRMMPWAYQKGQELHFGLQPEENNTEILKF